MAIFLVASTAFCKWSSVSSTSIISTSLRSGMFIKLAGVAAVVLSTAGRRVFLFCGGGMFNSKVSSGDMLSEHLVEDVENDRLDVAITGDDVADSDTLEALLEGRTNGDDIFTTREAGRAGACEAIGINGARTGVEPGLRPRRPRFAGSRSFGNSLLEVGAVTICFGSNDGELLPSKNETGMENSEAGLIPGLIVSKGVTAGDSRGVNSSAVEVPMVSGVSALLPRRKVFVIGP